ncbi:Thioesterase superfamily protein [Clostridium collagenovorans DSM 3089]|uniref:Thioesterase superfamily protein n=1 Tax=Clostridium collagenovorans DSM 3089 TaxID=1121306 RepID=A0A1M5U633_9CLOT|nr:PaaI family thioesterase [Clostridium collagenovorans]SHH58306.1 Thioesterase superfamily protein [Clostridium collagenovorans DSM 3089]
MKYKVVKKQNNAKTCIVCGLKNDIGLKTEFYELENGELVGLCTPKDEHQSYPERLHGGISSALLDETIGRSVCIVEPEMWGVTIELSLKYRKPVPLNEEIKIVGRVTKNNHRIFEGTGEIILPNGDVAVTAFGRYMKMPIEKITGADFEEDEWVMNIKENDPKEIEL